MENIEDYKKYYFLEVYINEITENLKKNSTLSTKEFFAIVIWKSNRTKTKIKTSFLSEHNIPKTRTIAGIMKEIVNEKSTVAKIKILDDIPYIDIPIASAILSVCYPDEFTVFDYRVNRAKEILKEIYGEIDNEKENEEMKLPCYRKYSEYFKYLYICKQIVVNNKGMTLRKLDQCLWGYDFYNGKDGLLGLTKDLE